MLSSIFFDASRRCNLRAEECWLPSKGRAPKLAYQRSLVNVFGVETLVVPSADASMRALLVLKGIERCDLS
jgi:hypothetical protein